MYKVPPCPTSLLLARVVERNQLDVVLRLRPDFALSTSLYADDHTHEDPNRGEHDDDDDRRRRLARVFFGSALWNAFVVLDGDPVVFQRYAINRVLEHIDISQVGAVLE